MTPAHQFSRLQGNTNYQVENLVHSAISLPRRGKKPALKSAAKWPETKKNIKKITPSQAISHIF